MRPWVRRLGPVAVLVVAAVTLTGCGDGMADVRCPWRAEPVGRFVADTIPAGASGTVLVAAGGRISYCRGFGLANRQTGRRAGCDTGYDVMSITKQFTAAAILKLSMLGKVRLHDRIGRFLGPVPADKRRITVYQLLTHTAGLVESLGDDYAPVSRAEMVRAALASRLRSAPGAEFRYSNVGYALLAAIVEHAAGTCYERFLARRLFAPAGMTHTGYVLPHWRAGQIAVEYDDHGRSHGRPIDHPWADDGPYWNLRGNGGMLSTARDMFRWQRALSGDTILSPWARRQLFARHVRIDDSDEFSGFGFVLSDTDAGPIAWHDGGNTWSLAVYARSLRDDRMVFWVSNHAAQQGRWNLVDEQSALTVGALCRARPAG